MIWFYGFTGFGAKTGVEWATRAPVVRINVCEFEIKQKIIDESTFGFQEQICTKKKLTNTWNIWSQEIEVVVVFGNTESKLQSSDSSR